MKKLVIIVLAAILLFSSIPEALSFAEEGGKEYPVWEIWGENMATEPEAADYSFEKAFDQADFRPTLTAYLIEDQTTAKGNIIVCSGGGDRSRSNDQEGIPACEFLNSIGYNAFLLDYRVSPYRPGTMTLDVQRAVRWLKHNSSELGFSSPDKVGLMGFSAGAMHCYGEAIAFSGNVTPDSVYPEYICDEVDAENADVSVVVCVYAAGMAHDTKAEDVDIKNPILVLDENDPNYPEQLPAFFFAGASGHFASGFCVTAYQALNPLTVCELHMYGGIKGPFWMGDQYDGADQMRDQLSAFLGYSFGYHDRARRKN